MSGAGLVVNPVNGFEAQMLRGAQKLGQTWESLKELLDTANFIFTEEGLYLNSFDRNQISLINLHIKRSSFQRYAFSQRYLIGLNIVTLYKAFKMCGKQTRITLCIRKDDPNVVYLYMANPASGLKAEVKMYSTEVDSKIMEISESVFPRHIRMQSSQFQTMIGYLSNFSTDENNDKRLLIEMYEDTLEFQTGGKSDKAKPRIILQQTNTGMTMKQGKVDAFSDEFSRVTEDALNNEDGADQDDGEVNDGDEELQSQRGNKKRRRDANEESTGGNGVKRRLVGDSRTVATVDNDLADSQQQLQQQQYDENQPRKLILKMKLLLKYVKYFTKAAPLCQEMRMFFETGSAAIFSFNVGTLGVLHFCISPVVADEGDEEEEGGEDEEQSQGALIEYEDEDEDVEDK